MMNRKTKYLGKGLLLLAGIGLCGVVVMEASQQMVRALDLSGISPQPIDSAILQGGNSQNGNFTKRSSAIPSLIRFRCGCLI
jgi:hypothetical protein